MAFRIPADDDYCFILGRATYNFAYYEWIVIYTLEKLQPGYLSVYSTKGLTSGRVAADWNRSLRTTPPLQPELQSRLEACAATFDRLYPERNKLMHAHPYTAEEGIQQLGYWARQQATQWPMQEVQAIANSFDAAAIELNALFCEIWPSS